MNKNKAFLMSFLIIFLLLIGCSSEEKSDKELRLIMDTLIETENNQSFYSLINSLLGNEQDDELLKLTLEELEKSEKKMQTLSLKTKIAKKVRSYYEEAFENRKKVLFMLKENQFTFETKENFEKYLIRAEENEYKATEIIIKELNIKDIEN